MSTCILSKSWVFILLILLFIQFQFGLAQNSKWQLHTGYEQMYVSGRTTQGIAQRDWIWYDPNRGDLFTMRTSLTHGYNLGISYDLFPWWSMHFHFKRYYRRYYVWDGSYVDDFITNPDFAQGEFEILPYVGFLDIPDQFLGRTLSSKTWAFGTSFSHKLSRDGRWRMHYSFLLNQDLYEVDLHYFDTPVHYGAEGFYEDIVTNEHVEFDLDGIFSLKAFNEASTAFSISTNQSIGISRAFRNGMGLKFEFGFRGIRFLKNMLLDENHWELDLRYTEYNEDRTEVLYESSTVYNFPLYLGGYYSSLTFTSRPFRSKRDNPEWEHWTKRWKKKRLTKKSKGLNK